MKNIVDKIYKEFNRKRIDWNKLEEYVVSLGDFINHYDEEDEECILSQAYMGHRNGKANLQLTELFIKLGFDVTANEGKNGASCLRALCWSSYDKYILHVAEKLLEAGAISTIGVLKEDELENKGVLSDISWELACWNTGEYDSANIFEAYYEMVYRQQQGKSYKGIRAFRDAVGEKVSKVEKVKVLDFKNNERVYYLISCGDKNLILSEYVEFMINPYVREEAVEIEDVTDDFLCLIGTKIKGLRYLNDSLAKLSFDNGYAILVGTGDSMKSSETEIWLKMIPNEHSKMAQVGTEIESIVMWGDKRHSDTSTFYIEETIVLKTKGYAYGLYSHSSKYGLGTVRVERLHKKWVSGLSRSIVVNNMTVKHIEYVGDAIKWISLSCDEGIIYILSEKYGKLAIFMSEVEIDSEDILHIEFTTKGLKRIKFIP